MKAGLQRFVASAAAAATVAIAVADAATTAAVADDAIVPVIWLQQCTSDTTNECCYGRYAKYQQHPTSYGTSNATTDERGSTYAIATESSFSTSPTPASIFQQSTCQLPTHATTTAMKGQSQERAQGTTGPQVQT